MSDKKSYEHGIVYDSDKNLYGATAAQKQGTNGQTENLNTSMVTDPIVGKANNATSDTIKKNFGNKLQQGLDLYALGSGVMNYKSSQDDYGKTLDRMESAISELTTSQTKIADSLRSNVMELQSDASEGIQDLAVSTLEKNKRELMQLDNTSTDFASGAITKAKEDSISSINRVLNNTFKGQQRKLEDSISANVDEAKYVTTQLSSDIKNIKTEMGKVKKAKDEAWKNLAKDLVGYASYYVDPTGTTKELIGTTKYKNEYT